MRWSRIVRWKIRCGCWWLLLLLYWNFLLCRISIRLLWFIKRRNRFFRWNTHHLISVSRLLGNNRIMCSDILWYSEGTIKFVWWIRLQKRFFFIDNFVSWGIICKNLWLFCLLRCKRLESIWEHMWICRLWYLRDLTRTASARRIIIGNIIIRAGWCTASSGDIWAARDILEVYFLDESIKNRLKYFHNWLLLIAVIDFFPKIV